MDGDQLRPGERENQAAFVAGVKEVQGMQGMVLPAARDMGPVRERRGLVGLLPGEELVHD